MVTSIMGGGAPGPPHLPDYSDSPLYIVVAAFSVCWGAGGIEPPPDRARAVHPTPRAGGTLGNLDAFWRIVQDSSRFPPGKSRILDPFGESVGFSRVS